MRSKKKGGRERGWVYEEGAAGGRVIIINFLQNCLRVPGYGGEERKQGLDVDRGQAGKEGGKESPTHQPPPARAQGKKGKLLTANYWNKKETWSQQG